MSSRNIYRRKKKSGIAVPLIIVSCTVLVSAAAAALWQMSSPKATAMAPVMLDPSIVEKYASLPSYSQQASAIVNQRPSEAADSSSQAASQSDKSSSQDVSKSVANGLVPKQERVTSAYFDDATFIGDSISVGIKLYDVMNNASVYASTGIGLENIFTKKAVKLNGTDYTVLEALSQNPAKKVYVMLGANSLLADYDYLIGLYGNLVDEIKARAADDAYIYIQSVLPINEEIFHVKYSPNKTTNSDIDEFNERLRLLAEEKNVYFLDVASAFKDKNNSLSADSTTDGMHIISSQYTVWFDYLKTHAIPE